mmetsp:Transcript_18116/g.54550  ORF Transcript_18116/g.54550 Transcript_18116/m.54550 type:complete len:243 (-) Transcript_18116:2727-3455(-)
MSLASMCQSFHSMSGIVVVVRLVPALSPDSAVLMSGALDRLPYECAVMPDLSLSSAPMPRKPSSPRRWLSGPRVLLAGVLRTSLQKLPLPSAANAEGTLFRMPMAPICSAESAVLAATSTSLLLRCLRLRSTKNAATAARARPASTPITIPAMPPADKPPPPPPPPLVPVPPVLLPGGAPPMAAIPSALFKVVVEPPFVFRRHPLQPTLLLAVSSAEFLVCSTFLRLIRALLSPKIEPPLPA